MSIFPNMASIAIPESDIPKLEKIASMSEGAFNSLIAAFKTAEPSINLEKYSENLAKVSPEIKEEDLLPIITIVFNLYRSKDSSGLNTGKVVALVIGFLSESYSANFPTEKLARLQKRLVDLFNSGNTATLASRSLNVLTAHEHLFTDARIFSDLRPIFGDSVESVQAAVMVHNLKLSYRQNGEDKDLFIALDNDDIETLKKVIERAENKTRAMVSFIKKSQVIFLDVKEK